MGSHLDSTLANAFLIYFEKNWLQNCSANFRPHYYRRDFNYIFVLFTSPEHSQAFGNCLNGRHVNMSFTIKNEKQSRISFLDVQIVREDLPHLEHLPLLFTVNLPLEDVYTPPTI